MLYTLYRKTGMGWYPVKRSRDYRGLWMLMCKLQKAHPGREYELK